MAINLVFTISGKVFMIRINGRDIYWNDKKSGLQMLYPTPSKKAIRIGNSPTKEDMAEYEMCKTEKELSSFVVRDCKKSGAKLIKREETKWVQ